ncbi:MAG: chemotaxis protein CheC [Tissierellia bacterium]|nr:chemotaxis protein CheC [Tissierellia bacterium]
MEKDNLACDILKEIFNIGVGKAANMLSQMLDKKILLDVPNIEIIEANKTEIDLIKYFNKDLKGTIMVSSISFQEELNGEANLIFPADKMRTIINLCIEEDVRYDEEMGFTDIDFDVIKEIGNIILNSIIGEIANSLDKGLSYTLPNIMIFEMTDFESRIKSMEDMNSLLISISFIIDQVEIEGAVIISFTISSIKEIMITLNRMEDNLYG